ncbi:flagellar FlbD family protein [Tepidimicrobium xylanilyticum]|uniref:flagellar FlbD family protein n=1 Tax=Tepidimicrobium xylanilyticum TaxID=1123352 RepID=UPI0026556C79|nr:flagellar FlbD family protein [Tepidimicrobium xylanilyticum]GMG97134.1 flagellar protein FlbD [Tepidimicrobium xylanilyticum]
MIRVKRLNGKEFVVNSDLIQFVEETPDTVITLTTGQKIVVSESIDEIIDKVIKYKAIILKYKSAEEKEV